MATITPALVREVITTALSDSDIEGLIVAAETMFSYYLGTKGIVEAIQTEITRYLAAHFVSLKDQTSRIDSEKIGDAAITFSQIENSSKDIGLKSTRWGQMAIIFDPTGVLLRLGMIPPKWVSL